MRKRVFLFALMALLGISAFAQKVVVKNNLLYDALLTPNLSLEIGLGRKTTFDLQVGLNPFKENADDKKFKHILVQPEFRYWFCERFNGWFLGVHALGGRYNVGNYKMPLGLFKEVRDARYEGWFVGAGAGIGYQWVLSRRWSVEAEVGAGYVYADYDKYRCGQCGTRLKSGTGDYFGVTKAALSLVYVIK